MDRKRLLSELQFKATRSSGPGGQHVNKTSTRVELNWHIHTSHAFSEEEKLRIKEKLSNRITKEGYLSLASQNSRSQYKNKQDVISRFLILIEKSLQQPKKRKKTKPSQASKIKRLSNKKAHSEKKANRQKPKF